MESSTQHKKYRPEIDGLRAVSVFAIIIFHIWPEALPGGIVGIDVFFVISGFIITRILVKEKSLEKLTIKVFYARRIRRILPILNLVLIFSLFLGWFGLLADEYESLGKYIVTSSIFITNFALYYEANYFEASANLKPLLHLWSLAIVVQFYIIWPFVVMLLGQKRKIFVSTLLLFILSFLVYTLWLSNINQSAAFFMPMTRLWSLLSGAVIAVIPIKNINKIQLDIIGIFLIIISATSFSKVDLYPTWRAIVPVIGACFIILAGENGWLNKRILSARILVYIGLISYPLYLWHWPLLAFARIFESGTLSEVIKISVLALTLTFSIFSYEFIEKRVRRIESTFVINALVLFLVSIGVLGLTVYKLQGLPNRVNVALIQNLESQIKREALKDEACLEYVKLKIGKDPKFSYCRSANLMQKKWLLIIGDSHAHTLFPGFSEQALSRGYGSILLANSACPPIVGITYGTNNLERRDCEENIKDIWKVLKSEDRASEVLIAIRGPIYMTGLGFGISEKKSVNKFVRSIPDLRVGSEVFFDGIKNSIDAIRKTGKRAFFLLENPELGIHPRDCISPRPIVINNRKQKCLVSFKEYETRMAIYRKGIFDIESKNTDTFRVLDTEFLFCDKQYCHAVIDGKLLYADDDHLSKQGSQILAEKLSDLILGSPRYGLR